MPETKKTFKILLIFFLLISTKSFSQDFCEQKLNEAEDKFELGRFYEIPDLLSLCLVNGFTKEEKIRAYRLLTITYLYLDYPTKADESYLELLKLAPEYQVDEENDPRELIYHHDKFTTRPYVYLTGKAGFNFTYYDQIYDISMNNEDDGSQTEKPLIGYRLGLGAEFTIYKNFHLGVEGNIVNRSFELVENQFRLDSLELIRVTTQRQTYTEFEMPLYLKYTFFKPKISPYIVAGIAPTVLLQARIPKSSTGIINSVTGEGATSSQAEVVLNNLRRKFNYSVLAGVGLKYKIGINYITIEARYQKGMLNYSDIDTIWDSTSKVGRNIKYPSAYVDDFFKLSELNISFSFIYPLYKPRKIVDSK